jgi:methionyl-tRNA synthetase
VDDELIKVAEELPGRVEKLMDDLRISDALDEIWRLVGRANKYIDETTPWTLAKDESKKGRLAAVIYNLCEAIRFISVLVSPYVPTTSPKINSQLGITGDIATWDSIRKFGKIKPGTVVKREDVIFPRIDVKKELEELEKMTGIAGAAKQDPHGATEPQQAVKPEKQPEQAAGEGYVTIEDFAKLDLRVARVLEADKVEGTDKLLKLRLELGSQTRQVVSGIAKHYSPQDLIGRYVIMIANLKPVKLRGIESQGMILAAGDSEELVLATVDKAIASGSQVR